MKSIQLCVLFLLPVLFYSCDFNNEISNYDYYEKAFFLGEEQFSVDGTVFENVNHGTDDETLKVFNTISVRTDNVEGWEIVGAAKDSSTFECLITTTANGFTISKETIQNNDSGIVYIDFYLDDYDDFSCMEYYKEKAPYDSGYKITYYKYAYVAEAQDLSGISVFESYNMWHHTDTYHKDLNFSKPGWYKIVKSDAPINNAPKHSSGSNTCLNR